MSDKYNKEEESVLQKIQNQTGCLLLVVGVAMLAFVLTDLLSSRTSLFSNNSTIAGVIDGEEIEYDEYQLLSEQLIERARQSNPDVEINSMMQESYRQQAWNQLVQEKLVQKEYRQLGLGVSGEEMKDMTIGENTHPQLKQAFKDPQTGEFDKAQLSRFLKEDMQNNPERKAAWIEFERDLIQQTITEKYKTLLNISYYVTSLEARTSYYFDEGSRGVNLVGLNYATVSDSTVTVSDDEIRNYIKAHKHKYEQEASRDIEFVIFTVVPSKDDTLLTEKWIADRLERFKESEDDSAFVSINNSETTFDPEFKRRGDFSEDVEDDIFMADSGEVLGPYENSGVHSLFKITAIKEDTVSSVRISHILFRANSGDTLQALSDARKALADIRAGREKFEDLATEKNVDASRSSGGDLGWLNEGSFYAPDNFIEKARTTPKGEYFILKTTNGVQLGLVTEAATKKMVQVAQLSQSIQPSSNTHREYYGLAGELYAGASSSDKSFEEVAESMGKTKRVANMITEEERRVTGIQNGNVVAAWLFNDDIEVGDISDILEVSDVDYVVARVTKIREEGLPDIEDVRSQVEPLVRDQKKAEILKPQIEEALRKHKDASALAKELNTLVTPVPDLILREGNLPYVGQDEFLVGAAFGTPVGENTGVLIGTNGVYVIFVMTERTVNYPEDLMSKQIELRHRKVQTMAPEVEQELVRLGNVKDLRYKFS